ncbi:MAG: hypothetical protein KJ015_16650 [Myxococcales bacterium]|nr:hypothetical protein [Myxococcales bacterium]
MRGFRWHTGCVPIGMARAKLLGLLLSAMSLGVSPSARAQTAEARPDLIIGALALSHDRAAPDSAVQVELSVENRGTLDAGPFRVAIYHSDGLVVPKRGNVTRIGALLVDSGLRAGKKASFSARVVLPPCEKCRPGSLYAFADAWGTVLESSEENNFKAVPIAIDPGFRPNLRVGSVKLTPDRGPAAREVLLSAVVENTTAFAALGPFRLGVYCSDDAEMTKSDLLLSAWIHQGLAAQGRLAITRKVTVDTRCPVRGQHVELGVVADVEGSVAEADEGDNSESAPYWVFRSPDLVPGQLAISRDAAAPGSRVVISYRVQNQGKSAALPFKVGAYLSKDATITATDKLIDTFEIEGLAAQTTSGTLHHELTVPELASGSYFVGVIVDVDDQNGELRERNNLKAVPLSVRRVDITDRYFFLDKSSALAGDPLELRFSLRNTGSDTSGPFKVAFYYSQDPRLDSKDELLASFELKKLAKGSEAGEHVLAGNVPAGAAEGYRYVLMSMDDGDAVAETDEHDNIALRPVLIRRK